MFKNILSLIFFVSIYQLSMAQGDFVSIGVGPGMLYADNSGEYRAFKFKIQPAATISINKQISDFLSVRANIGAQMLNSGGYDPLNHRRVVNWGNQDQAFDFTGIAYFLDVTPILITNPNSQGMVASPFHFYAGLGFGAMYVEREQKVLKNGLIIDGELVQGDIITTNENNIVPYIPLKIGVSTNLEYEWDYAVEFSLMTGLNSEIDGNNMKTKTLQPDMIGQILFTVRRYIGRPW